MDRVIISLLEEHGLKIELWDEAEPSLRSMEYVTNFAKGKNFNLFVGLEGGSSVDTTKVINLITSLGGEVLNYVASPTGLAKRCLNSADI